MIFVREGACAATPERLQLKKYLDFMIFVREGVCAAISELVQQLRSVWSNSGACAAAKNS